MKYPYHIGIKNVNPPYRYPYDLKTNKPHQHWFWPRTVLLGHPFLLLIWVRVWYNKQTMNGRNMQERKRSILVFDTDDRGCGAMAAASFLCCEIKGSLRPCYCNLLERMHTSFHPPAANGRDQKKFMNEKGKQTNTVTNSCSSMASNHH
jgi:hypothetical protein